MQTSSIATVCCAIITITHSFCPATHTVLNGVLGSCSKLRSLNFTRGFMNPPEPSPYTNDLQQKTSHFVSNILWYTIYHKVKNCLGTVIISCFYHHSNDILLYRGYPFTSFQVSNNPCFWGKNAMKKGCKKSLCWVSYWY